mgnify:CR=1 FL=1
MCVGKAAYATSRQFHLLRVWSLLKTRGGSVTNGVAAGSAQNMLVNWFSWRISAELLRGVNMGDIKRIFTDSFRMYFVPLIGAFRAVQAEMKRRERMRRLA